MGSEMHETEPTPTVGHPGSDSETTEEAGAQEANGETCDTAPPAGTAEGVRRPHFDRPALITALGLLALTLGFLLFGVLRGGDDDEAGHKLTTAPVTYEVTGEGTVDISYQGTNEQDTAETASSVRLPWKETVQVPLGHSPVITITLDEKGGQARCAVAVRGRHVQSATASGEYGRATCSAPLPVPAPAPSS
jgi:hypothetical protein